MKSKLTDLEIAIKEAAEIYWKMQYLMALDESTKLYIIQDFIAGAKWQAQKTNRRSTERKDRNGVEIFEGDYLVDKYEDEGSLFQVVYCPRLMAWAVDTSYLKDESQMVSIREFFGDCLEVKNPLPLTRS
jgi:hypothetical protein